MDGAAALEAVKSTRYLVKIDLIREEASSAHGKSLPLKLSLTDTDEIVPLGLAAAAKHQACCLIRGVAIRHLIPRRLHASLAVSLIYLTRFSRGTD
jgi:hypothetical protein